METLNTADGLLQAIGEAADRMKQAQDQAEQELAAVRARHESRIRGWKEIVEGLEKNLLTLMKTRRDEIFDNTDQVTLRHGLLLHGWEDRVRIPRDAAEKIEEQGWEEALKRVVTVNRAVVEKWPVERLTVIGAEKKAVETFTYEVKEKDVRRVREA